MFKFTRRQLIKSGLAVSAVSVLPDPPLRAAESQTLPANAPTPIAEAPDKLTTRERLLLDANWKFALGNADDPDKDYDWGKSEHHGIFGTFAKPGYLAPATAELDDSSWPTIDLPHDWAVELPFVGTPPLPEQKGGHPLGRAYPSTSIGWYRKSFNLSPDDRGKRIQLEFDGVFRNAIVLLNGHYVGVNFSGYAPFLFDVTDWVNTDEPNLLTLRVDATLGAGWFYEGAGIYRHVWLIKSDPVHLVEWGSYVRPEVDGSKAQIKLASEVRNDSDTPRQVNINWRLLDANGTTVASTRSQSVPMPAWSLHTFEAETKIDHPSLWSIETPTLYRAVITVESDSNALDSDQTTFGIRTIRFDAEKGFFLNGKPTKIKGTCCHQDHAGVGVALPDRMQYFRVERLKDMSSNALRTSHSPPTPALMDATDSLGMLVMCETRLMDSSPEGLSQLERMIRRFRNHPSIILWSLGNEEPEQGTPRGAKIVFTMLRLARRLDPTRPYTVAMNGDWGSDVSQIVDVQGFNYRYDKIDKFHKDFPQKPCIGTETASVRYTRGAYENDEINKINGYLTPYDSDQGRSRGRQSAAQWLSFYDDRAWLAGGFEWSGFDYRGEPKPYDWPNVISQSGSMDLCGFPKDIFYYYKAWWSDKPVIHVFPHWTWPASKRGQNISVWCFTNTESAELFLNGKSQGAQKVPPNGHVEWNVGYEPGAIEVRGSKSGRVVITEKRETTGAPTQIALYPDRPVINADGQDVSIIRVEVQDAQGRTVPIADQEIVFQINGSGKLIGLGNGCPNSHEPDKGSRRRVFNGLAQVLVQSLKEKGSISLQATSQGLGSKTVTITANPAVPHPAA